MKSPTRKAVEETVQALCAKILTATENDRPGDAQSWASALDDSARAMESVCEAESTYGEDGD